MANVFFFIFFVLLPKYALARTSRVFSRVRKQKKKPNSGCPSMYLLPLIQSSSCLPLLLYKDKQTFSGHCSALCWWNQGKDHEAFVRILSFFTFTFLESRNCCSSRDGLKMEIFNGICNEGGRGGLACHYRFFRKWSFVKTIQNRSLTVKTCFAHSLGFILYIYSS